ELKKAAFTLLASQKPSILLLDEPEAGLDPGSRCQLASLMARLSEEGVGIVLATHDEEFGRLVGDKFYTIEEGVVSEV
ncbi:MAG: AAA family ATPase, partial [Desulfurococcales archaeon]|nr:AAA family ATPase [Desulfurococcales archaeon]